MHAHDFQKVAEASFARLDSIAKDMGISDKPEPAPVISPSLRAFVDALTLCPDDDAARIILKKHAAGYPGFACLAQQVASSISSGQYSYNGQVAKGVCPFFYIARFVGSEIEMLDEFLIEKHDEEVLRRKHKH